MANGKHKGNGFEREVSKLLSLWISKGEDKYLFWRSASSGAMAPRAGTDYGDITSMKPEGYPLIDKFTIECKRNKRWDLFTIMTSDKTPLNKWWEQTENQSDEAGNVPLLVFKLDRYPIMCAMDLSDYESIMCDSVKHRKIIISNDHIGEIVIFFFEDFMCQDVLNCLSTSIP